MDKKAFMRRVFREEDHYMTSPYGYRTNPVTGLRSMHWGEDYGTHGKKLVMYSPVFGIVKKISYDSARGKYIDIKCAAGIVRMQHCDSILARVGQRVAPSSSVAVCGSTGASTGVHLHIECRTLAYLHLSPDKFLARYSDPVKRYVTVKWNDLNVRTLPSLSGQKKGQVHKGEKLPVYAETTKWVRIKWTIPRWISKKGLV